jgi:hypothetical protein
MYHKVKIKKLPNKAVGGGINGNRIVNNQLLSWGGADFNMAPQQPKVTNTITGVSHDKANLEAEGGETVYGDINGDGMAEHLTIKGPRHSSGGVPLNLPDNTFIFSDTKSMKIKDPDILAKFGKSKGSYTPADLAKQYDLSKYRKILQDPESSVIDKKTAELMIRNYNMKLGALALAQESKKGFPQGIPEVARPYMMANDIKDEDLIPQLAQQNQQEEMAEGPEMQGQAEEQMETPMQMPNGEPIAMPMGQYGMEFNNDIMPFSTGYAYPEIDDYDTNYSTYAYGGSLPKAQDGLTQKQIEWLSKQNIGWGTDANGKPKKDVYNFPKKGDADYDEYIKFTGINPNTTSSTNSTSAAPKLSKEEQDIVDKKWNGKTDLYLKFKQTENALKNNAEIKQKLHDQYKKVIEDDKSYTGGKKSNWYGALKDRDPDAVVNALLAQEERNLRLKAFDFNPEGTSQGTAKGSRTNAETEKFIKEHKDALGDLDFTRGHVSQAAYIAYDNLINGEKPEGYDRSQTGKGDELAGRPTISGIDNANTNTTLGQFITSVPGQTTTTTTKIEPCSPCADGTVPVRTQSGDCPCGEVDRGDSKVQDIVPQKPTVNQAQWMTPDLVNYYGAIKDKSMLRKFMSRAATADLETPTPVYLDPTRELAAQSEQANIASQMLGQFAGSPQAASARLSNIQGQGAAQAANTLANINNQNVGIANQFAQSQANINNQEQGLRQQAAQRLYDQNTLANQQFLNSQLAANEKIRQGFNTGWKNASNLALTNAMYDQYDIDPRTGTVVFQGGKDLSPEVGKSISKRAAELRAEGWDQGIAFKMAKEEHGVKTSNLDALLDNASMANGGMYVMGSNVFPPFFY